MGNHNLILSSSEVRGWQSRQEFFWEQLASGHPPFLFDVNPETHSYDDWTKTMTAVSTKDIAASLKKDIDTKEFIDVSSGVEMQLGVSKAAFKLALELLKAEGYNVYLRVFNQVGTEKKASIKVLAAPGKTYREIFDQTKNPISKPENLG